MIYFVCIFGMCVGLILMDTLKCNKILKQLFYGVTVIVFIALATIRSLDFPDTPAYVDFYNSQIGLSFFAPKNTQFEIGFVYLTRFCILFSNDYRLLFFAQALIINLIALSVLNKSECKLLLYACFMAFYGIYTTFIIMRAGLAIAFFVLGVIRFDKNWVMRILSFAIAGLFHMSAIVLAFVYLFAYLFKRINLRAEYVVLVFLIFLILYVTEVSKSTIEFAKSLLLMIPTRNLFIAKAINYLTYSIDLYEFGISFRYLLNALVFVLGVYTVQKQKIKLSNTMRANMMFIFLGLCLESVYGNMTLIGRITDFSNILNIGTIGIIVKNNMSKINSYQITEIDATTNVGKIRGLQWYSLLLACIFVSMNLVFMYRIVY